MEKHIIKEVKRNSPGFACGLKPGDVIVSINDEEIKDIFDYQYQCENINVKITALVDGIEKDFFVEKDEDEDIGLVFEEGLMDRYRHCSNNCLFCFIDQMPPGMRDTLYFKDDDSRLSFLQGNYITLTNMDSNEIDRIIKYNLAPVNISFHTMNPQLRCKMLNNRFAGEALSLAYRLRDREIPMNGQIVLCKGINDGKELDYSLEKLYGFLPYLQSLSIVPVGLTKYREGLPKLAAFEKKDAEELIEKIKYWQDRAVKEFGTHFVHLSDEWYILAGQKLPPEEDYDGYLQIENGVGMLRSLMCEFEAALMEEADRGGLLKGLKNLTIKKEKLLTVTGKLAYPYICEMMEKFSFYYPQKEIKVVMVENNFFGKSITVTGLLTGGDVLEALKQYKGYDRAVIPENMLKRDEPVFLDDMSLKDLETSLQLPIGIVKSTGRNMIDVLLNKKVKDSYE